MLNGLFQLKKWYGTFGANKIGEEKKVGRVLLPLK